MARQGNWNKALIVRLFRLTKPWSYADQFVTPGCWHPTHCCSHGSVRFRQKSSGPNDRILDYRAVCFWPDADGPHPAHTGRSSFKAAGQARIALLKIERQLPRGGRLRATAAFKSLHRRLWVDC